MKKLIYIIVISLTSLSFTSCWMYSFTGGNTGDAKTIQIDFFRNEAPLIESSLSQRFTEELQALFIRQTNLTSVNSGGDLHFEGEIVDYSITPMSATANQVAAQNKLTISVNVRYTNKLNEKDNFEKRFSSSDVFNASQNINSVQDNLLETIFEQITQDIFTASIGKW